MSPESVNGGIRARQVQRLGWVPDLPDARDYMYSAPEAVLTKMPKKVDLRGTKMPPVWDQGELGSCTAQAIGSAFEFSQIKQGMKDFMPSALFIYYNERAMEGTIDTDSGAMIRDGMKSVAKIGVCPETIWPYVIPKFTEKPPAKAYTEAKKHQALVYRRVLGVLHQMQGCLAQGYPFVFGFAVYESFMSPEVAKTGKVPLPPRGEQLIGGHAVLAVGYDDSKQAVHRPQLVGRQVGPEGLLRDALRLPDRPAAVARLLGDLHRRAGGSGSEGPAANDEEEDDRYAEADSGRQTLTWPRSSTGGLRRRSLRSACAAPGRASRRPSGRRGARFSTGAASTGRRGCSASRPTRGLRSGSRTGRSSVTRASASRASCPSSA